ncbi:MAG: hypothetical protein JST55_07325 [Bacteroidetes bacterium]|nr:hypothetical protein [Bacteroidota bacterium]
MKKILLLLAVFLLASQVSFAQDTQWFTITYNYFSGPVSPQYQKTYAVTVNYDRSASVSYHQGIDKMAPQVESFTISKTNHKKLTNAIKKIGIYDGVSPNNSGDGKIGGPEYSITVTYGNPNPNLDQPVRTVTMRKSSLSSKEEDKLFDLMDKIVPKKVWKKFEKKEPKTDK